MIWVNVTPHSIVKVVVGGEDLREKSTQEHAAKGISNDHHTMGYDKCVFSFIKEENIHQRSCLGQV